MVFNLQVSGIVRFQTGLGCYRKKTNWAPLAKFDDCGEDIVGSYESWLVS